MPAGVIPASDAELAAFANELKTKLNAVLAKLDADAGVNDTNYAALHSVTVESLPVPSTSD